MKMRLKEKLLLPVILTFILAMIIDISYLYMNSATAIKHEIQKSIENNVSLSVNLIDSWLEARITDVRTWSTQQIHQEALTKTGEDGKNARKGAENILSNLEKGYPYYDFIFIADPEGRVVSSSPIIASNKLNVFDREYFKQSIKGQTWISEVMVSRKTGNKIFVISEPVKFKGRVVGILAGTIDIAEFSLLFMDNVNPGKDGFAFLAEKNGEIFIASPKKNPMSNINQFAFGKKMLLNNKGISDFKTDNGTKILCFKKVEKTGWLFAQAKSLDSALEALIATRDNSVFTTLIVLFIVIFVVSALFKRIVHTPLAETLKVIKQVDKGNFDEQISVGKKNDEIGMLINSFNQMVARLKETLENLRREVEERKTAEYKLEQHLDNLEELVNERTLELKRGHNERKQLEARLHLAEKMEAIGTLAGGVAHDLNNILSGILSYPELILLDLPEESPLRPQIKTIYNSGKKAAAIVQDLLTLARRGAAVVEITNINTLVEDYIASPEYDKMISFHPKVHIESDLEPELMNTTCSPVHLSKTIMNLVSNAAESMPDGGTIRITTKNTYVDTPIRGYEEVDEGEYTLLIVSDDGIGIPAKDISRIYEPFYTKKQMGRSGTGLGMAVVWNTVKDYNGYIVCESVEGCGTLFKLYFPVSRLDLKNETGEKIENEYSGNGERVLIIDDIPEQREIASAILSRLGYNVYSVSSGERAIEFLKEKPVDILILDMVMEPGMDGFETYQHISRLYPGQKAVIASGFSKTEQIKMTLELGAGQHIAKPYVLDIIGKAVRDELTK